MAQQVTVFLLLDICLERPNSNTQKIPLKPERDFLFSNYKNYSSIKSLLFDLVSGLNLSQSNSSVNSDLGSDQ